MAMILAPGAYDSFKRVVVISLMAIVFYMMVNTRESESEEDPESRRRRYLFSSLDEVSEPDEWMALNHRDYS